MNSLNMNLVGATVVLRLGYRHVPVPINTMLPIDNHYRIFAVSSVNAGEGAYRLQPGCLLFGRWLHNDAPGVVDGDDIERLATVDDLATLPTIPVCTSCHGDTKIHGFTCVTCAGSGRYTPAQPLREQKGVRLC